MESTARWRENEQLSERAVQTARDVLADDSTTGLLETYYAKTSNYAGSTFADLEPNDPSEIGPSDLLAVTTLSVSVHPAAIRCFRDQRSTIVPLLRAIDPDWRLEKVEPAEVARPMAELYEAIKAALRRAGSDSGNSWVTASKICARKRPNLFPVRDRVVLQLLALPMNYPDDWPVFRSLMLDTTLIDALDARVAQAARNDSVDLGDPDLRLRHLDVALWMAGSGRSRGSA